MRRAVSGENLTLKPKVPSEKHDVLFSKARYFLNQRHIKRPWFNLNPFLEKTDEDIDLENFLPGESKYIQPLESLVLCESVHSEKPVDTKEISLDVFFPYLFSTAWDKGCSLRILEGQLLDEILLGLYRLENEEEAVRHTTHALAKNRRPRSGCYKLHDERYAGNIEETLLIEFAHFGRLIKETPNKKTLDAFEYLKTDLNTEENTSDTQTLPRLLEKTEEPANCQGKGIDINQKRENTTRLVPPNESHKTKTGICKSMINKHVKAMSFLKAMAPNNKHQPYQVLPPIQQSKHYSHKSVDPQPFRLQNSIPGTSPSSESRQHSVIDRSYIPSNRRHPLAVPKSVSKRAQLTSKYLDQKRQGKANSNSFDNQDFKCKIYSINFDDDCISEKSGVIEEENQQKETKDEFFGEEFYLSDHKGECNKYIKSAKLILEKKKMELQARRKEAECRKKIEAKGRNVLKLPELPKIDMENLEPYRMFNETIKMPDEVPTLEEFVQILKCDEYYDPRYRNRGRQKSKKIADRYYMAKEMYRPSKVCNTDELRKTNASRRGSRKSVCSMSSKMKDLNEDKSKGRPVRLPALRDSCRSTDNSLKLPDVKESLSIKSMNKRGQEVLGVTGSEPCKNHYINCRRQTKAFVAGHSHASINGKLFPKIQIVSEGDMESLDTESNESLSAESLEENFDTNKLNMKYSIERIRKKRRGKAKKKTGIIGVLAKYYNMQNMCYSSEKSPDKKENNKGITKMKTFGRNNQQVKQDEEEEMVIGELKKFKFLNVRNKKKLNLEKIPRGDFTSTNLENFHQQLKEALDMFVVRREIVVSDINTFYTATTTVTFTKISCFQFEQKRREELQPC